MMRQLWSDECGVIVSSEIIFAITILVIGIVTGLSSYRDAVITELADVGGAIAWLDQSYHLHGVKAHSASTANVWHADLRDFCDDGETVTSERCMVICDGQLVQTIEGNETGAN